MLWNCFEAFYQECCAIYTDYEPDIEYCRRAYNLIIKKETTREPKEREFWEEE